MYNDKTVAVVILAYNEADFVAGVVETVPTSSTASTPSTTARPTTPGRRSRKQPSG